MIPAVTLVCCLAGQQLSVSPFPAVVGDAVAVRAHRGDQPIVGEEVRVDLPDGSSRSCGMTDGNGAIAFVPDLPGQHVFALTADGVRLVAPHQVVPARPTWLLSLACVPLGLALLWRNLSRARGRRDP